MATDEVPAKSLVRSIEAAWHVHFGRPVKRNTISIAQIRSDEAPWRAAPPAPLPAAPILPEPQPEIAPAASPQPHVGRMAFVSHEFVGSRGNRSAVRVLMEYRGNRYQGSASGWDQPQARMEAAARATLGAVEAAALDARDLSEKPPVSLTLEGVTLVRAVKHPSVLVSVTATDGREATPLVGAARTSERPDTAVIMACLKATDRWVRGRLEA